MHARARAHTHTHTHTQTHTHKYTHSNMHTKLLDKNRFKKPGVRQPLAGAPGLKVTCINCGAWTSGYLNTKLVSGSFMQQDPGMFLMNYVNCILFTHFMPKECFCIPQFCVHLKVKVLEYKAGQVLMHT